MKYYIAYKLSSRWFTQGPMDSMDAAEEYNQLTERAAEVLIIWIRMDHTMSVIRYEELVEG